MRLTRPRYTILSLMIVVLVAGLVLGIFVVYRDHQRRRVAQRIALATAKANYQNAILSREVAEIAVTEFTEGILKQDLAALDSEIALAKSKLMRAQEMLAAARRPAENGGAANGSVAEREEEIRQAKLRLEHAQQRKTEVANDGKGRILKELSAEVDSAKANEAVEKAVYEQVKAKAG